MKALHVVHKVCHYIALWCFVLCGFVAVLTLSASVLTLVAAVVAEYSTDDIVYAVANSVYGYYSLVSLLVILFVVAVIHLIASILFRQLRDLVKHNKEKKGCCSCGCEVKSDLDSQVAEVLKWKNLYVEGVITEREFIDKRNEILRIAR